MAKPKSTVSTEIKMGGLDNVFTLHDEFLIAPFGVVVFSVVAQGLTMPLLLQKLGRVDSF
jgi:NhaP-type Na+/H+ or K+/H+ antiporter